MQNEIRVRGRASCAVPGACDVSLFAHPSQRLLCLIAEPAEQAGPGRRALDRADPADMEGQGQGV